MSKYGGELQNYESARNVSRSGKSISSRQHKVSNAVRANDQTFRASVIHRKSFDHRNGGASGHTLNRDDLVDMFGGMSVRDRSRLGMDLSTVHEVDNNVGEQGAGDYSTLTNEYDQNYDMQNGDDQAQYATLTQDNMNRFENDDEIDNNQRNSKKNDFLQRFAEPQYEGYDDIYDDDGDGFDSQIQQAMDIKAEENRESPKQTQGIATHTQRNGIRNPFISVPLSKYMIKSGKRQTPRSESMDSFSSLSTSKSVPTATSSTSYTESDSEQSDYSNDFADDELDFSKAALVNKLQQRQKRAEEQASTINRERRMRFRQIRENFNNPDYVESNQKPLSDDFENLDELDSNKLRRFRVVNDIRSNIDMLDRKRSMPVLMKSTDVPLQSAKAIRKYSSTLDLPSRVPISSKIKGARYPPVSLSLKSRPYYNNNNSKDDSADDENENEVNNDENEAYGYADPRQPEEDSSDELTITLADYEKLKRKSHRIDLTKYQESPTKKSWTHHVVTHSLSKNENVQPSHNHHRHRHQRHHKANHEDDFDGLTNTARLSKEGKLKIIRSLGKHKTKQVLPGHLYGEIVYDPDQMKWCGNDEDLLPFESVSKPALIKHYSGLRQQQSEEKLAQKKTQGHVSASNALKSNGKRSPKSTSTHSINKNDENDEFPQVVGNMVYDNKKLRWVSLTGKYEDDPFQNMDDTLASENANTQKITLQQPGSKRPSRLNLKLGTTPRGNFARGRIPSSVSCSSIPNYAQQIQSENPLKIRMDNYKMWKAEETRWMRKVRNWFPSEDDDLSFCYELKSFLDEQ